MTVDDKKTKQRGRPKKNQAPLIPWEEIDHLLVCGEEITNDHGDKVIAHPSYRELGKRFDVAHSLIAKYSRRHNCLIRRKDTQIRTRALAEGQLIARRAADLSVTTDDALQIIDLAIIRFGEALEEGRARVDTVADLNTLLRLKQLLIGEADSRKTIRHEFSLVELQRRHQEWLRSRGLVQNISSNTDEPNALVSNNKKPIKQSETATGEACSLAEIAKLIPPESHFSDEMAEMSVHFDAHLNPKSETASQKDECGQGTGNPQPTIDAEFTANDREDAEDVRNH